MVTIERLEFDEDSKYSSIEAAIHAARYGFMRTFCPGRRVLDVACGEGYGSFLMAKWGAASVCGVDVSVEAVDSARKYFSHPKVSYHAHDAQMLDEVFATRQFDVVACFETIEHVSNPVRFLQALRRVTTPDSIIVISCPNDYWYYPTEETCNPFHIRKYHYDEFFHLAESVLGPTNARYLGGPCIGFMNAAMHITLAADDDASQSFMVNLTQMNNTCLLPAESSTAPTIQSCSYFIGVWGAEPQDPNAAIFPISMDALSTGPFGPTGMTLEQGLHKRIEKLWMEISKLQSESSALADELAGYRIKQEQSQRELRDEQLRRRALEVENDYMRGNASHMRETQHQLVIERGHAILERDHAFVARDQAINERDQIITARDQAAVERDRAIAERDELSREIAALRAHVAHLKSLVPTFVQPMARFLIHRISKRRNYER